MRGAHLALLPEAFVAGYPRGLDFGAVVGSRTAEGREQFAVTGRAPSTCPARTRTGRPDLPRPNRAHLVVGVVERSADAVLHRGLRNLRRCPVEHPGTSSPAIVRSRCESFTGTARDGRRSRVNGCDIFTLQGAARSP